MTLPDRKFTDRDVRENSNLVHLAINYLMDYKGEFEFLLDAQEYFNLNGELSTPQVRGVLNCARSDSRWAGRVEPTLLFSDTQVSQKHPKLRVVKKERYPFDLNTRVKRDFIIAPGPCTVAHLVDHARSVCRFYPNAESERRYEFKLYTECGQRLSTGQLYSDKQGKRRCTKCCVNREDRSTICE